MKAKIFLAGILFAVFCFYSLSYPDVPQMINYQGKITDPQGALIDTTIGMIFTIYDDSTDGAALWSETQPSIIVEHGIFSVLLGSITPIPDSVFDGSVRYLGVKVGNGPEMTPRKSIISVAYAYRALEADTADYARAAPGAGADNDWIFQITDGADTTLVTGGKWGIARAGNILYGTADSTHVNLGVECTTGINGEERKWCTVGGGLGNTASRSAATVGGGRENIASDFYATIGGGYRNTANMWGATVGGGRKNIVSNHYATISGGDSNTVSGISATIGGGNNNLVEGDYSAILGGKADTITSSADYSYLFGIGTKLTEDSTFMLDMPHIRFGDEANGYEFPTSDGSSGQVMQTNGSGQLTWVNVSGGGGDITAVYAGTGLTGGGETGDVTLNTHFAGSGAANTVARSDHNHDATYVNEGQSNSITSTMITDGTITNTDISNTADIVPSKISGTAWTSTNDGSGSGLDADMVDGIHASTSPEPNKLLALDSQGKFPSSVLPSSPIIKSVQNGEHTIPSGAPRAGTINITISAVNTSKAFCIAGGANIPNINGGVFCGCRLSSSTNLQIRYSLDNPQGNYVVWQVIEFY